MTDEIGTQSFSFRALLLLLLLGAITALNQSYANTGGERPADHPGSDSAAVTKHLNTLLSYSPEAWHSSLSWLKQRNKTDVVAPLIYTLRYSRNNQQAIIDTLKVITGADDVAGGWFNWMLWQQAHPAIKPYDGFVEFQAKLFRRLSPDFRFFVYPGVAHEIRMEEVVWGGVPKDGIPALYDPALITADQADYLNDDDLVFGININGDIRAYPYRIMDWHEMFNDVIGGVPVALAYCTLCGSGILYDTRIPGESKPMIFGSSGLLYRSNKLMYDAKTHSLWNQFTGRPVVGELTGSGVQLKVLPLVTTTWKAWREQHPNTKVLSDNTGHQRDYSPGKAYQEYFSSPYLMFPALAESDKLQKKDRVFGLRMSGADKAWPLSRFAGGQVINDRIGVIKIVLVGNAESRTVRAYRAGNHTFVKGDEQLTQLQSGDGEVWHISENQLRNRHGETLSRLPGHLAYWFAWSGYLGDEQLSQ